MTRNFDQFTKDEFEKLDLYTTAIIRAHREHHPEFTEIRAAYEKIQEKYNKDTDADLTDEFEKLRKVTNEYEAPKDTCETTVATFELLKEANALYTNA